MSYYHTNSYFIHTRAVFFNNNTRTILTMKINSTLNLTNKDISTTTLLVYNRAGLNYQTKVKNHISKLINY